MGRCKTAYREKVGFGKLSKHFPHIDNLIMAIETEPGGFFALAGLVLSRSLKGTMEQDLQSLKANLEKA